MKKVRILDSDTIYKKIDRMAYEIAERNFEAGELVFVGLNDRGSFLAKELSRRLKKITGARVTILRGDAQKSGKVVLAGKKPQRRSREKYSSLWMMCCIQVKPYLMHWLL